MDHTIFQNLNYMFLGSIDFPLITPTKQQFSLQKHCNHNENMHLTNALVNTSLYHIFRLLRYDFVTEPNKSHLNRSFPVLATTTDGQGQ